MKFNILSIFSQQTINLFSASIFPQHLINSFSTKSQLINTFSIKSHDNLNSSIGPPKLSVLPTTTTTGTSRHSATVSPVQIERSPRPQPSRPTLNLNADTLRVPSFALLSSACARAQTHTRARACACTHVRDIWPMMPSSSRRLLSHFKDSIKSCQWYKSCSMENYQLSR